MLVLEERDMPAGSDKERLKTAACCQPGCGRVAMMRALQKHATPIGVCRVHDSAALATDDQPKNKTSNAINTFICRLPRE